MQKKNMIRFISVNTAAKTHATISTGAKIIFINVKITVNKCTSFSLERYSKYLDPTVSFCGTILIKNGPNLTFFIFN